MNPRMPIAAVRHRTRRPCVSAANRAARVAMLAAVVAPLAACGGEPVPATPQLAPTAIATATVPPTPDPSATPVGGFGNDRAAVGPVVWTLALDPATGGPGQPVEAVPDDAARIWAAAPLVRATPGVRLRADWSYNGTDMPVLAAEAIATAGGGAWAMFDLALPTGERWPVGDYTVTISVDGQPAVRGTIPVVAADS